MTRFEFTPEGGRVSFSQMRPGVYAIAIEFDEGHRGGYALAQINHAMRWMFCNTDALMIEAAVDIENQPSLVMARNTHGYKSSETRGSVVHCRATIAQWAKDYGLESAIRELRAAGQAGKADKLEAAKTAAGAL